MKNQASWYGSSWRGLQSDASTPDDSRLITPETTPPQFLPTQRRDPEWATPDVPRFERSANGAAGLGWRVFKFVFRPFCMAHSLVMAGESAPCGRRAEARPAADPPQQQISYTCCRRQRPQGRNARNFMSASVQSSWRTCRLHAIFMNQLMYLCGWCEELSSTGARRSAL